MRIRRATTPDIPLVAEMWNEAAEWLGASGYDQWQYPVKMHNIEAAVAGDFCWIVEGGDRAVGTVTLDAQPDLSLWTPNDDPYDAIYLHRLVVRRANGAQELGSAIIDWASMRALNEGKSWLRLDAWTSNTDLHRYYRRMGFEHLRTVSGPGIVSGALFQRKAGAVRKRGPIVKEI